MAFWVQTRAPEWPLLACHGPPGPLWRDREASGFDVFLLLFRVGDFRELILDQGRTIYYAGRSSYGALMLHHNLQTLQR